MELEKRLLSQPNLGPLLILKDKSNSPGNFISNFVACSFSVHRNYSNAPKKCKSSPKDFLRCMFQPVAMGSFNYKQRHNHFSNNDNLQEFVIVHQQCLIHTHLPAH